MRQAYDLASGFMNSCPSNNPVLFLPPYPPLTIISPSYTAGQNISLYFDRVAQGAADTSDTADSSVYLAFLTGSGEIYVQLSSIGQNYWVGLLPEALGTRGTMYGLVTRNNASVEDADVIAGMAVFQFPYNATVMQGL
jgi:hypothetical protein